MQETVSAAQNGASDEFVVEFADRVIGKAGAWRVPEIGYILHPDYWGRGLAYEAMQAVIEHLFASHAAEYLIADVDPRNAASIKLLQRLGFHESGRVENTLKWGDEWCDSIYFMLRRETWHQKLS